MTVDALFEAIDSDGSGGVSWAEFERWWSHRSTAIGTAPAERDAVMRDARALFDDLDKVSYGLQPVPLTVHHYGKVRVITLTCSPRSTRATTISWTSWSSRP